MFKGQSVLKFIQIHIRCVLNNLDETEFVSVRGTAVFHVSE